VTPVRFHHLLAAARSGAHAQWALEGGEDDETYPMEGGAALHGLLLQGAKVLCFDTPRRGKAWDAFAAENPGAHILSPAVYDRTMRMAEAVHANRDACDLLEGIREQTLLFRFLGVDCRSTPDVRTPRRLVELKSTKDASVYGFPREIERRHYHAQMAFQREAVVASNLGQPDDAFIVAVESTEPHVVTLFRLTPGTMDWGARLVRLWMERLVGCMRSGAWPGYSQVVVNVELGQREDVELDFGNVPEAP
jgi:PDDEXK-like uncharacterized protein DUF3799